MQPRLLLPIVMLCTALTLHAQQSAPENKEIAEKKPAAVQDPEKPLPPVAQLLADVERNEKTGEALQKDYTYHVHFEEDDYSGDGRTKKTTVTDSESITIGGVRVDRLVAKDGVPLNEKEKQKESERIDKVVTKDKERREKLQAKGKESTNNGEAVMPASRFLELGAFTNPRRETDYGRPTIVFDYAGDPHAKTNNETEGVVRDLVGTIWIDEADHVMVKAEGHFLKDFKVGGGLLVNIHQGLSFSFRKQKINDEVWLPAEIDGNGSARIFLFAKIDGRVKLQASDYKKFRTGATILPGFRAIGPDGQPLPELAPAPPQQEKGQPEPSLPQS